MGEVRSNLLTQAMKNTKVLPHPLLQKEESAFYMKASAAGLWEHMRNGPLKRPSEESAGLWILTSLIFSYKIIHVSAGTKSLQMYLGEVLQASNEFQFQNFRYCEAQTADKGEGRLWIVLPKSSDLSDTWSFSCKKESNVYLRVARHAWVMFLLFFLIFTTFFTTAFLNVQEKFLASVPLIVKPHWRVKYILVKVCNCNCLLWFLGRQTLLVLVKV